MEELGLLWRRLAQKSSSEYLPWFSRSMTCRALWATCVAGQGAGVLDSSADWCSVPDKKCAPCETMLCTVPLRKPLRKCQGTDAKESPTPVLAAHRELKALIQRAELLSDTTASPAQLKTGAWRQSAPEAFRVRASVFTQKFRRKANETGLYFNTMYIYMCVYCKYYDIYILYV